MKNRSLEEEINEAVNYWDIDSHLSFLKIVGECFSLFDVEEDFLDNTEECEDEINVRLIRTVYLISKLAEFHSGALVGFKVKFPKLWEKIMKHDTSKGNI